jgi:hypothetical protein
MQIPENYRGRWSGTITDTTANSYPGLIVVDADNLATAYSMAKPRSGRISIQSTANDRIVIEEVTDSFDGTLELSLDSNDKLRCTWRMGKRLTNKVRSHAIMSRAD